MLAESLPELGTEKFFLLTQTLPFFDELGATAPVSQTLIILSFFHS